MKSKSLLVFALLAGTVLVVCLGAIAVNPVASSETNAHDSTTANLPGGISSDWWTTAQEDIRQSEYNITWQDYTYLSDLPSAYHAPNRAQGFRTYFTPQGIRVIPRGETSPSWELRLSLVGDAPTDGAPTITASRIEYPYESANQQINEYYINDEGGLQHGFVLQSPLDSLSPSSLAFELALSGSLSPHITDDGTALEFTTPTNTPVLRYGDLRAVDSLGHPLPAYFSLSHLSLSISVDCRSARYPVTITSMLVGLSSTPSGLSPVPNWIAEGDQADAYFGSGGPAGDVNGDGYADVIVGAGYYDNGEVDEGTAFVYYGSAAGLSTTPSWTAESNQAGAMMGGGRTAGDVNGDGYSDIIVSAASYDNPESNEGAVFVWYGSAGGLGPSGTPANADWTAESNQPDALFGCAASTAGDVDGDGFSDVIVAARAYDNGQTDEGAAFAWYGSAGGLGLSGTPANADWTAESNQASAEFGIGAGIAGDVNGDGYSDVIVGADQYDNGQTDEGSAFVYYGSASGLSQTPDWTAETDQPNAYMGYAVGTAGDINGDGYADVIVGAGSYDNDQADEGAAFVWYGSTAGLGLNGTPANADWMAESHQTGAKLGRTVATTAGDVNGDGYADVIVGAMFYDNGQMDEGATFVWYGSAAGLGDSGTPTNAAWMAESDQADAWFGDTGGTAGDVNGDGYADVIVGAPCYDNGQSTEGRAYVYHGSSAGLGAAARWTAEGGQVGAQFGVSVGTAGDVNGDGYADVIVGAPFYDNGETDEGRAYVYHGSATGLSTSADWMAEGNQANAEFGSSVGTAGDVNGDGYTDIIVGAIYYDNGETDEGTAYVYLGAASGLSLTPAWAAESNQAYACFGTSVATAGDVNGDGYADVIVGAINEDHPEDNEGRAYAYYGSATGLSANPDWTAESDQAGALFGAAVNTAGDVNGDGYTDVIVGAFQYDNGENDEGQAYVYHGSGAGLSTSANWTAEGNQIGALFGISVGTVGDVNGDGYADVIVGAAWYDNGQAEEGRAYTYHGSATGLSTAPSWTTESNQEGARLGYSVGTAGDVNGDGYADAIVGVYWYGNGQTCEGQALVFHGSSTGLSLIPDWAAEGDQTDAWFGRPAGTAGDVNGDGYADVIVGARYYDNGEADEGRAFVYYGNEGPGLELNPRQRRSDDSAPIAPLGKADANAFRVALIGHTPFGRGKVKLEWEAKPLGVLFDGTGTQQSSLWMDTGTAGVQMNELASSLLTGTAYHWRVRLLYNPITTPFQQHSRWLTVPWNGWNEEDLRTEGGSVTPTPTPTLSPYTPTPTSTPTSTPTPSTPTPTPTPTPGGKSWVLLLYLDGDTADSLGQWLTRAIVRLESLPANPYVDVVVLFDQVGYQDAWKFVVQPGGDYTIGENKWPMGELNMGDPQTLIDFVTWARDNYPAEYYYLSIADHGRGTRGIAYDDVDRDHRLDDYLTPGEVRSAMQVVTNGGADKLDVLHYDACLMDMLENAYQVREYADFLIASENLAWSVFAYEQYVPPTGLLQAQSEVWAKVAAQTTAATSPQDLAAHVAEAYYDHPSLATYPRTIAALSLGQAVPVRQAVDTLAAVLRTHINESKTQIQSARVVTQKFDSRDYGQITDDDEYVDLYHLAYRLKQFVTDAEVQTAAQGVMDALGGGFIVAEYHAGGMDGFLYQEYCNLENAHGVAIYFPPAPGSGDSDYSRYVNHESFLFTTDSQWDDFLVDYFAAIGLPPEDPEDPGLPPMLPGAYRVYLPVVAKH